MKTKCLWLTTIVVLSVVFAPGCCFGGDQRYIENLYARGLEMIENPELRKIVEDAYMSFDQDIVLSDYRIPNLGAEIVLTGTMESGQISGLITFRDPKGTSPTPCTVTEFQYGYIPYRFFRNSEELERGVGWEVSPSGIPLIPVEYLSGVRIYSYVAPTIYISRTPDGKPTDAQASVLIKELVTWWLYRQYVAQSVLALERGGISTTVSCVSDGEQVEMLAINQSLQTLFENEGRFRAIIDVSGSVMVFPNIRNGDQFASWFQDIEGARGVQMDYSEPGLTVFNVFLWDMVNFEEIREFPHMGDLDKIP